MSAAMSVVRTGALFLLIAAMLVACGVETPVTATEQVQSGPLRLEVQAEGELESSKATPLVVPGSQWAQRQLEWMVADGSQVGKGELVARFAAPSGELELKQAMVDLQRNTLARLAKQAELGAGQGRVAVDLSQVHTELGIAQRYAGADLAILSKNEVLDAVQDTQFLGTKQDVLEWKQGQSRVRGDTELAVLDAQRATYDLNAKNKQDDLDALELRAPHDGVLMLTANWTGEKPAIGSAMRAGFDFASLPDIAALEVELNLPQLLAQGLKAGQAVVLHPIGRPDQRIDSTLSWVASSAKVLSRDDPVKYLAMKAPIDADAVRRFGLVPGQRMQARVVMLDAADAISVPNVALVSDAGAHYVKVVDRGGVERRKVGLGVRGPSRSQVLDGLQPGDRVVLAVTSDEISDETTDTTGVDAPDETAPADAPTTDAPQVDDANDEGDT
jgi:hypothetical protein